MTETLPSHSPTPRSRSIAAPNLRWPLILYAATWLTTYLVAGVAFSLAVMTILTLHELGHYLQTRRYSVPATLPFFIPMPLPPFGTMGAIIRMQPRVASPRELFDIAVSGPLAGLAPALAFSTLGLYLSKVENVATAARPHLVLGEPLARLLSTFQLNSLADRLPPETVFFGQPMIFKLLSFLTLGPLDKGDAIVLHPLAWAGWVGIFITSINLLPIGQLDGGHILYTLLPRKAYRISSWILVGAVVTVILGQMWQWALFVLVLLWIGIRHPPGALGKPLDRRRMILGWMTLLFVVVGFTPTPIGY